MQKLYLQSLSCHGEKKVKLKVADIIQWVHCPNQRVEAGDTLAQRHETNQL
jgi:hypothetical protein